MRNLLLVLALTLVPAAAYSIDSECVGLVGPVPTFSGCELAVGSPHTLRFCTPQTDIDGDPLPLGAILSCTITVDGVSETIPVTDPGVVISHEVVGKNPGHMVSAYCTSADGAQGVEWGSEVCFPTRPPSRPRLLSRLWSIMECAPGLDQNHIDRCRGLRYKIPVDIWSDFCEPGQV